MKNVFRTIAVAVAFGALGSEPAFANDMDAVYSDESRDVETVVRYDDLDLTREVDARALYERLERAAVTVCADARRTASPLAPQIARSCADRSLDRAVSAVGAELLTRLHKS